MRLPLLLMLPLFLLNALVDWYVCRAARKRCKSPWAFPLVLWSSIVLAVVFFVILALPKKNDDFGLVALMWGIYAYFSIYIPKYVFVFFDLVANIPCLLRRARLKWLSIAGAVLGACVFGLMWWGVANRHNIDVQEVTFAHPDVPAAFNGYRVLHFSDLHVGSYGTDTEYVAELVSNINHLRPDMVLFTGDIVNRQSAELEPFVDVLKEIKAPVYSVLGNHDYGDYYRWKSEKEKDADVRNLMKLQRKMGWKLLNNQSKKIRLDGDQIVLIGVENIGDPPFAVYGDLDKAYPDLADPEFKILMSHNPAHWNADIADAPDKNIALTLSGHTHAMQVRLFGWSPASFRYDTWGGMYSDTDNAHHLYVNIGIGVVAVHARIGATPELTLITLRRE